jgi:hypothetical protein
MREMGVASICVKDMAGVLSPAEAYDLVRAIKDRVDLPVRLARREPRDPHELRVLMDIPAQEAPPAIRGLRVLKAIRDRRDRSVRKEIPVRSARRESKEIRGILVRLARPAPTRLSPDDSPLPRLWTRLRVLPELT